MLLPIMLVVFGIRVSGKDKINLLVLRTVRFSGTTLRLTVTAAVLSQQEIA